MQAISSKRNLDYCYNCWTTHYFYFKVRRSLIYILKK